MGENQKFGENIWPGLAASKLLRRPLGGHRLAEFSTLEGRTLREKSLNSQKDTLKYKVFASTWNIGGVAPSDDLDLEDWLDTKANSYDVYVLGFQEIVPLSARNVLGPEKSWISMRWNSLIRDTLNNRKRKEAPKLGGRQEAVLHQAKDGSSRDSFGQEDFRCIMSKQMVGIFVSVWVRNDLWPHIRHLNVSCIGSGIMGCLGNKGAVSVRFFLHETSFCFVCCHLASGGKQSDVLLRNFDAADILSRTSFPGGATLHLPKKILDHDRVLLFGDLNYRISLQEAETRLFVKAKKWSILLERDQLLFEFSEGRHFEGWQEGLITFSPTYKYHPNSDQYYCCIDGTGCKKKRAPAWCDRILWRGKGLKQIRYERCNYRLSDHRPVRAVFSAECEIIRGLGSLGDFCVVK